MKNLVFSLLGVLVLCNIGCSSTLPRQNLEQTRVALLTTHPTPFFSGVYPTPFSQLSEEENYICIYIFVRLLENELHSAHLTMPIKDSLVITVDGGWIQTYETIFPNAMVFPDQGWVPGVPFELTYIHYCLYLRMTHEYHLLHFSFEPRAGERYSYDWIYWRAEK